MVGQRLYQTLLIGTMVMQRIEIGTGMKEIVTEKGSETVVIGNGIVTGESGVVVGTETEIETGIEKEGKDPGAGTYDLDQWLIEGEEHTYKCGLPLF